MAEAPSNELEKYQIDDDGIFPNNDLPVLHYKNVLNLSENPNGDKVIQLFEENNWANAWKNGVYDFHHYHSNTHEVLGAYHGKIIIQLGGENGVKLDFEAGDVVIIPAGVAHKNLTPQNSFKCVGAYPDGRTYDMNYGKPGERPQADKNIAMVPMPDSDPVFGRTQGLINLWREEDFDL